jgi:hypothetical protein
MRGSIAAHGGSRHQDDPTPRPSCRGGAGVEEPGPGTWKVAAALFLLLFAIYLLNFRQRGAGDSIPTRRLPFSLLREGNLNLDEFTWERNLRGDLPYFVHYHDGHIYSVTTVATALVVTPLYVLPAWWLSHRGLAYDDVPARVLEVVMERIAAAIITALSAAALFLTLCRLTTRRWAIALTLIYGLGTSTWSISSQALWNHGLAQLTLATVRRRPRGRWSWPAGRRASVAVVHRRRSSPPWSSSSSPCGTGRASSTSPACQRSSASRCWRTTTRSSAPRSAATAASRTSTARCRWVSLDCWSARTAACSSSRRSWRSPCGARCGCGGWRRRRGFAG